MSRLGRCRLLVVGLLFALGSCCPRDPAQSFGKRGPSRSPPPAVTAVAAILPRPLYFLSDHDGSKQVWSGFDGRTLLRSGAPNEASGSLALVDRVSALRPGSQRGRA